jgi:hypothetical protein
LCRQIHEAESPHKAPTIPILVQLYLITGTHKNLQKKFEKQNTRFAWFFPTSFPFTPQTVKPMEATPNPEPFASKNLGGKIEVSEG